ncbi:MAG: ADP-ribosylation factor-like protein, partial [Candidatus Kariarchaeaceae archaeon]
MGSFNIQATENQIQMATFDNSSNLNNLRANLLRSGLNNIDWPVNKPAKIVVLGLTGAGKSTIIEFFQKGDVQDKKRKPTLAFSFNQCDFGKIKAVFVDVPGQESYWANWASYLKGADGVLFVIDATKLSDVSKAYSVYLKTMSSNGKIPVAILANKQDIKSAISGDMVTRMMSVSSDSRETKAFDTIALTGNGLFAAIIWLLD